MFWIGIIVFLTTLVMIAIGIFIDHHFDDEEFWGRDDEE